MQLAVALIAVVIVILAVLTVLRSVRIVPQARARNVERLGRYRKTLEPGMNFIIPFIDRVKPLIDLREQVVAFKGQPVITEDNLVVLIDTVLFFQVTDPRAADYEIVDYIGAIEQITATMLRSVIGSMDLEQTLTSRDHINNMLRGVLDEASGKWGIRVTRVEIKAIDPPKSVVDAMEKQMRAEREKRAAILTAEGVRQSKILTAEGEKQGAILKAEGDKQSAILRAQGQAQAIRSIHDGDPSPKVLAYQYLQTLPLLAQGEGNTFWIIPSEVTTALKSLATAFEDKGGGPGVASAVAGLAAGAGLPAVTPAPSVQPNGAPATDQKAVTDGGPNAAAGNDQRALTDGLPNGAAPNDQKALTGGVPNGAPPAGQPAADAGWYGPPASSPQPLPAPAPEPAPAFGHPPLSPLQPDREPDGQQRAEGELHPPGLP
jgi:regulator of protease activity HflC (stomatin/prohibitin superfamily)